jgi:glycosyltransferase involved in cell wall biosynthesis
MPSGVDPTVLHYVGADDDRGGIVSVVRALASTGRFRCVLGVNRGFQQRRPPPHLETAELSPLEGETLGLRTLWRSRVVAREVRAWLNAEPQRIFHGHSRAGLAVALWLRAAGEHRVVASVHCYGRRRWFYRWAASRLGERLFWLSPAMKRYYGIAASDGWTQCVPGCVPPPSRELRSPLARAHGKWCLGGVGALVAWKRWHLVLEALALLSPALRARVRFVHIGAPDETEKSRDYAATLQARTIALGLSDTVEWRGHQPNTDALWPEIDCLVVASHHEPFSVAMLEALRAGVPVLASRSGGNPDVIVPASNGWLFEPDDSRDLAHQLAALVETDVLERAQIEPDQLQPFTAPVVAEQWSRIYARVFEETRSANAGRIAGESRHME